MTLFGQNFKKHKWKNRLVLIITNDIKSPDYRKQMVSFRPILKELEERKLIIYKILPESNLLFGHPSEFRIQDQKVYDKYKKTDKIFEIVLIGLDGAEKFRQTEYLSPEKLFAIIDGMPMRRSEIKSKNEK